MLIVSALKQSFNCRLVATNIPLRHRWTGRGGGWWNRHAGWSTWLRIGELGQELCSLEKITPVNLKRESSILSEEGGGAQKNKMACPILRNAQGL